MTPSDAAWFKKEKNVDNAEKNAVFTEPQLLKTDEQKSEEEKVTKNPNAIYVKDIQFEGN